MSDTPHICVICGESLIIIDETVVVDVLPTEDGIIQRVVHKKCIDDLRESLKR